MPQRHNLIQPPPMPDPIRSMTEMLNLANGLNEREDRAKLEQAYTPIPVPSQSSGVVGGGVEGGGPGTGALGPGATIPGAVTNRPASVRPPTRDEVLSRAPSHMRGAVQKQFDDADAAAARAVEAQDKASVADADYLGHLGVTVRSYDYNEQAFQMALDHAKKTYAKNPTRLQAIQQLEQQWQADPEHRKRTVDAAIAGSPEQQKLEAQRVKAPTSDYERELDRIDTERRAANQPPLTRAERLEFRTEFEKANRAPEKDTKPTSFDAAILEASGRGALKEVNALIALKSRASAAGREGSGPIDAGTVQAVVTNPSIWGDLPPTLRAEMLKPLAAAGFDFAAAAKSLSAAQKGQIERWRTDQITDLNKRRASPADRTIEEEYEGEKARIEESFKVQMGTTTPPKASPAAPGGAGNMTPTGPLGADRGAPKPSTAAAPTAPETGPVTVTLPPPDGRTLRFKTAALRDAFLKKLGYSLKPAGQ